MISIVTPCFNSASTLAQSIESALEQVDADYELIVIDDGSTDDSLLVARRFEPKIRVLNGPNNGASLARNKGIAAATGEWLVFLDADDMFTQGTLRKRLNIAEGADVIICDWEEWVDGEGGIGDGLIRSINARALVDEAEIACATYLWAPTAAVMYRRALVEKIGGFREDLPVIQDARFLFDAAYHGARFVHSEHIGARYRISPQSLSRRDPARFWRDVLLNGTQIEAIWRARGALSEERQEALAGIYNNAARGLFQAGDDRYFEAVEHQRRHAEILPLHPRIAVPLAGAVGLKRARQILGILGAR